MKFFVIDVESVGLHGGAYAVAGGIYEFNGQRQHDLLCEFKLSCPPEVCAGRGEDRDWIKRNVPAVEYTHNSQMAMRHSFWQLWLDARSTGAVMAADCSWPVEARFLAACIDDAPIRKNDGPYPLHEIGSFLQAAGMNPLKEYPRLESELPRHDPLNDARQSARLLSYALDTLANGKIVFQ